MSFLQEYAQYYDLLYSEKDYTAEADFICGILDSHAHTTEKILDLGAGTGRHASLLVEKGYSVDGIDSSAGMLEAAWARKSSMPIELAERLDFQHGDIRTYRSGKQYDAVTSLFHVMSYLQTAEDFHEAFSTVRRHLKPGGVFLFDCWYGPCVLSDHPKVRVRRGEDESIEVTRISEPELLTDTNSVNIQYTLYVRDKATGMVTQTSESHLMRYLFMPEIEGFLKSHGMRLVLAREWMTGRKPGTDTFSVYFVARAE